MRGDPSWEQDLLRNRQEVVRGEGGGAHPQKQRQPLWTKPREGAGLRSRAWGTWACPPGVLKLSR